MRIDPRRSLRTIVLATWAGFFGYLWLSGEMTRYLGPRTYWVVIFGTIALGGAALAHLFTLRTEHPARPSFGELLGSALLIVPVIAVVMIPSAELGALAASRKSSGGLVSAVANIVPATADGGPISFIDIHYATESAPYAELAGVVDGAEVELVGFVTGSLETRTDFDLTRFYVSCCAADAVPYSVEIDPGGSGGYEDDQWLEVTGSIEKRGDVFVVIAEEIRSIEAPDDPYLI